MMHWHRHRPPNSGSLAGLCDRADTPAAGASPVRPPPPRKFSPGRRPGLLGPGRAGMGRAGTGRAGLGAVDGLDVVVVDGEDEGVQPLQDPAHHLPRPAAP